LAEILKYKLILPTCDSNHVINVTLISVTAGISEILCWHEACLIT